MKELTHIEGETTQPVKITCFRTGGKYYSEATIHVPTGTSIHDIWDHVTHLLGTGQTPGPIAKTDGTPHEYIVLVNCPGHRDDHPRLIFPSAPQQRL